MIDCQSWIRLVALLGIVVGASACTASKDITQAQKQLRQVEDFRRVDMGAVTKPLGEYRKTEEDEVLFHLEHGMLEHFQQNWDESSSHFQRAQRAIEENYTKSINRNLQSMLVNDLQLAYDGESYEDIYLNTVKCLNYLHRDDFEGAMVEARKVTHELEMLSDRYKGLAESVQLDTAQAAVEKVDEKLDDVDLLGEDEEAPVEIRQNSALGRFITTILHAKQGNVDDARIEFQQLRTALNDQGHTNFLADLSQVASAQDSAGGLAASPAGAETALLFRLTPEADVPPPSLQVQVGERTVQTIKPTDMQRTQGRYSVRLTGAPAAPGDSVTVRPTGTGNDPLHLEVWSDSLQYRGPLEETSSRAAFSLGEPVIRGQPGRESRAPRTDAASGDWQETGGFQPVRLDYALTRETPAGLKQFKLTRVLEPERRTDGAPWRIIERIAPALGTDGTAARRADTMRVDGRSFELLRFSHSPERGGGMSVHREGDAIVEAASRWARGAEEGGRSDVVYGEGMGFETALARRSLSVGTSLSLPVYASAMRRVQTVRAMVTSTDSVATPAGSFPVYVVRAQGPNPSQGTATLYLRSTPPHHVVQARTRVPISHDGRPDTLTLRRTLTGADTLSGADVTEPSPIASTERPAPPDSVPSVPVSDGRSPSPSGQEAAPLVPTPEQLTQPDAYNALFVSFSGRAPKKRERSYTFNFEIDGEEVQLEFAIPVLEPTETDVDRIRAIVAGDTVQVPIIEDMQEVAQTMFDEKKSIIYTRAVIRSFLKAAATEGAEKLAEDQGGAGAGWLAEQVGEMASGYAAQADTRGWQTMPGFSYATVANLPSGTHDVTFEYLSSRGTVLERRTRQITVNGPRDLALAESIYLE